jgi:fatty-acyl-CoA synthase
LSQVASALLPPVDDRREALRRRFPQWRGWSLAELLDSVTEAHPDRPLVITDERVHSYRDVQEWSARLAEGLRASGVRPGEHVALVMANYPEFVALKFAIARVGAVAVPVNFLLRRDELAYVLEQSDAVLLVTMNRFRSQDYLAALDELVPGWERLAGGLRFPKLRQVVVFSTDGEVRAGTRSLADLAGQAPGAPGSVTSPSTPADIIYTSGTTGTPKGVIVTHDMFLRTAYASAWTRAFEDGRRILFSLPLYHVFGYVEGLLAALFAGGAIIPQVTFDPVGTLHGVGAHRASEVIMVPTMTLDVLDAARRASFDLSSLRVVFSSGGQSPATVWQEIRHLLGAEEIFTGYGMTETTASTTCTAPDDPIDRLVSGNGRYKPADVAGDPALDGVLAVYKTLDLVTGEDLPPTGVGELVVRGPAVTAGYYNKPEETAAAFDAAGWFRTGDIGRIDAAGYLSLTGRKKECYRCGGELVVPREVEDVLLGHPAVVQAHVVPLPHDRMGEVGVGFVVLDEEVPVSPSALVEWCGERLARFKVPAHVVPVPAGDLPTSATGKVQKFLLAEWAKQLLTV